MILYHGSPYLMSVIEPRNMHGDLDTGDLIFATPSRSMALAYAGCKWTDCDITQQYCDGQWNLIEMRHGVFDYIFRGVKGYLYQVSPKQFKLYRRLEMVSVAKVVPLVTEEIGDVWTSLNKAQDIKLTKFESDWIAFGSAIGRIKNRISNFTDEKHEKYLRWIAKNNKILFGYLKGGS